MLGLFLASGALTGLTWGFLITGINASGLGSANVGHLGVCLINGAEIRLGLPSWLVKIGIFVYKVLIIWSFFVIERFLVVARNFLGLYFLLFTMTFCLLLGEMLSGYVNAFLNIILETYFDFILKYFCYYLSLIFY